MCETIHDIARIELHITFKMFYSDDGRILCLFLLVHPTVFASIHSVIQSVYPSLRLFDRPFILTLIYTERSAHAPQRVHIRTHSMS